MREIKFRAWHKTLLIMIPQKEMSCHKDFYEYGIRATLEGFLTNPNYEIMQYTGLKSEIVNEIYEGDIIDILYEGRIYRNWTNKVVVFFNGCFGFYWENNHAGIKEVVSRHFEPFSNLDFEYMSLKYKGNIHENPELLK